MGLPKPFNAEMNLTGAPDARHRTATSGIYPARHTCFDLIFPCYDPIPPLGNENSFLNDSAPLLLKKCNSVMTLQELTVKLPLSQEETLEWSWNK